MEIKGISNTTLNDYPGVAAATIFTGGCDFCCPYCHNRSLVVHAEKLPSMDEESVIEWLAQRKSALEGICITGGEPLQQADLGAFMYRLKELDYKVKLDTNGYDPTHLSHLLKENLIDFISMDIKNTLAKYAKTAGCPKFEPNRIRLSVDLIRDSGVDYEFRTTVVKELHSDRDMEEIGQWLRGVKAYYIQPYVASDDVIMPVFSSYDKQKMLEYRNMLRRYIPNAGLRGYEL